MRGCISPCGSGVYDRSSRTLRFASAGHHPGFLVPAARDGMTALRTRNGLIGVDPGTRYGSDTVQVPPGACLYLFSDGVFEIVTKDGIEWGLNDFLPHLLRPAAESGESRRLYGEVRRLTRSGSLDDDFSLLVLTFD
jgi:sigma-B regulation protein RsbU (phosphoserine phosphatase)